MNIVAVIPARLQSSRLERKVLADIAGRPMLWHVWSRVMQAKSINQVYIATDSAEIQSVAKEWGASVCMTSTHCESGSARVAEALMKIPCNFVVNVQADEPLIDINVIDVMVERWQAFKSEIITVVYPINRPEELADPNVVKVVRSHSGRALYFSRGIIPYVRDCNDRETGRVRYWGHVGVYGFEYGVLMGLKNLQSSALEFAEKLEQLRFLEHGLPIDTIEAKSGSLSVDTLEDLEKVRRKFIHD